MLANQLLSNRAINTCCQYVNMPTVELLEVVISPFGTGFALDKVLTFLLSVQK